MDVEPAPGTVACTEELPQVTKAVAAEVGADVNTTSGPLIAELLVKGTLALVVVAEMAGGVSPMVKFSAAHTEPADNKKINATVSARARYD